MREKEKLNCWDFKKCGLEPGGTNSSILGVCTAACAKWLNGINFGKNGGRACWAVKGTMCDMMSQEIYAQKIKKCLACHFYKIVREEEGKEFQWIDIILDKIWHS